MLAVEKRQTIQDKTHLLKWMRTAARLRSMNALRKREERHLSLSDATLELLELDWQSHDDQDSGAMIEAM